MTNCCKKRPKIMAGTALLYLHFTSTLFVNDQFPACKSTLSFHCRTYFFLGMSTGFDKIPD